MQTKCNLRLKNMNWHQTNSELVAVHINTVMKAAQGIFLLHCLFYIDTFNVKRLPLDNAVTILLLITIGVPLTSNGLHSTSNCFTYDK